MSAADLLTPPARYVRLTAGTVTVGQLAASTAPHPFAPDGWTGTTCLACWGWCDDVRYVFHVSLTAGKGNAGPASGSPGQGGGSRG